MAIPTPHFRRSLRLQQYGLALRVALIVGSVLFTINHGQALFNRSMNRDRWVSGLLSYCVPFLVSLHGQRQGK